MRKKRDENRKKKENEATGIQKQECILIGGIYAYA